MAYTSCVAVAVPSSAYGVGIAEEKSAFSNETVKQIAKILASRPYENRRLKLPPAWSNLSYDEYRDIRFRAKYATWAKERLPFQIQLFAPGGLFNRPVKIYVVEQGQANELQFSETLFDFGKVIASRRPELAAFTEDDDAGPSQTHPRRQAARHTHNGELTFSGFRIHNFINNRRYRDEFAVFQGASYFRAIGRGQVYGISARGLAVDTAQPRGEEFPYFRAFWIERPRRKTSHLRVHALLDSPSITGAYRFTIYPGRRTIMDVELTLYPRKQVDHVGLAPLTSMFLFRSGGHRRFDDFRPAVHDSDGLSIWNGRGEWLWRPLSNPKRLQISAFMDDSPQGFGLEQRNRDFSNFQDLEAHYEKRPTLWIKPKGKWGKGGVELVEIPTNGEIHDNIVAFWKPEKPLKKGSEHTYAYRMYWGRTTRGKKPALTIYRTSDGKARQNQRRYVIDFIGKTPAGADLPKINVSGSRGRVYDINIIKNPETGGMRASFILDPQDAEIVDLRLSLHQDNVQISEVWTYRWERL